MFMQRVWLPLSPTYEAEKLIAGRLASCGHARSAVDDIDGVYHLKWRHYRRGKIAPDECCPQ